MHFTEYRRYRKTLAHQVRAALPDIPTIPFRFAHIVITRHSGKMPDFDNLYGGLKPLLDTLVTTQGRRHPDGLGLVLDDTPTHVTLAIQPRLLKKGETPHTTIEIKELNPGHPSIARRIRSMGLTAAATERLLTQPYDPTPSNPDRTPRARSSPQKPPIPPTRLTAAEFLSLTPSTRIRQRPR